MAFLLGTYSLKITINFKNSPIGEKWPNQVTLLALQNIQGAPLGCCSYLSYQC